MIVKSPRKTVVFMFFFCIVISCNDSMECGEASVARLCAMVLFIILHDFNVLITEFFTVEPRNSFARLCPHMFIASHGEVSRIEFS